MVVCPKDTFFFVATSYHSLVSNHDIVSLVRLQGQRGDIKHVSNIHVIQFNSP